MNDKHLIINYIVIEKGQVLVGATDGERWKWDKEDGMSGADAKTIVWVTLTGDLKSKIAVTEEARFHCPPEDPVRPLAMEHLSDLFYIAWKIKKENLDGKTAHERYFGYQIK